MGRAVAGSTKRTTPWPERPAGSGRPSALPPSGAGSGERFGRHDFIERVGARSGAADPRAAFLTRVVLEVTDEATHGAVAHKVRGSLPADLRDLVASGSTG
ncbi:DUF2267 domain-containing protein [Actinomadura sp. 1N219]|uniref:DUF2267 domain-containing protein n=1 Tax=Actinomadura sp. 1N219 TaxID=3375152 RepID=UPI00378A2B4F